MSKAKVFPKTTASRKSGTALLSNKASHKLGGISRSSPFNIERRARLAQADIEAFVFLLARSVTHHFCHRATHFQFPFTSKCSSLRITAALSRLGESSLSLARLTQSSVWLKAQTIAQSLH